MDFFVSSTAVSRQRTDCAIVGVYDKGILSSAAEDLDRRIGGRIASLIKQGDLSGKSGESLLLTDLDGAPCRRIIVMGLGVRDAFKRQQYRKALSGALALLARTGARDAVSYLGLEAPGDADTYALARTAVEVAANSQYHIPDHKTGEKRRKPSLVRFGLAVAGRGQRNDAERAIAHGKGIVAGMSLMRDLANQPASVCTPAYLTKAARALAGQHRNLNARILTEAECRRLKMGAFLSVTAGTEQPAYLIVLEYHGAPRSQAPIALIGKGITFDTGGISLKPPAAMDEMKFDMSGAASVFGAFKAVATLGLPINLVGVIPTCENMPSGSATKPGDIVTSMSGQTIEVLNTDAEGRLILCDAITYARRFKPRAVIDIATLTGACVIALGNHYCGLFSNDDELAAALEQAGRRAEDRAWRMPTSEEYLEALKSNFADFANVGGREAGAITAACFLGKFTAGLKWAHLDIAGIAYQSGAQKGSTGRPVPLLVDYLLSQ
ncbi:leucyl aminopeptidase [Steroidobacter denitrificans]|uniref:Probable cytosol aminopeptidase n=1 Tax=Steroidobacter denitrificans TaxID=465721 RepID=A0A127F9R6_STEDE|nr:leucyl aminopeptidase [Steroidobacter denitrificans]AMN46330.1 leucyl aminopeptidase [Steroidobacter denitrificans]